MILTQLLEMVKLIHFTHLKSDINLNPTSTVLFFRFYEYDVNL